MKLKKVVLNIIGYDCTVNWINSFCDIGNML